MLTALLVIGCAYLVVGVYILILGVRHYVRSRRCPY